MKTPSDSVIDSVVELDPFDTYNASVHPDAANALRVVKDWTRYAYRGQPRGLLLWSQGYGCGKSHLARCAYLALSAIPQKTEWGIKHRSAQIIRATDFFTAITDCYAKDEPIKPYLNELLRNAALIVDDYKTDGYKNIEWTQEQFFKLLDRLCESKPLLITTNLNPEQFQVAIGGRNWSRFYGMTGDKGIINMSKIPDYRKRKAAQWN